MNESIKKEYTIVAIIEHHAAWDRYVRRVDCFATEGRSECEYGGLNYDMDDLLYCGSMDEAKRAAELFKADVQEEIDGYVDDFVSATIVICEHEVDDISSEYVCSHKFATITKKEG